MSTFTLTGSGTQALAAPGSLKVSVTVLPASAGFGSANPRNYYGLGQLRVGTAYGYLPPIPVHAVAQLIPCPNGTNILGYALPSGVTITVEERAEQPYAGPTGPPGAAGATGAAGSAGLSGPYETQTLAATAANIRIPASGSLPSGYHIARIRWRARTNGAVTNTPLRIRFNGDSGSNYDTQKILGLATAITASNDIGATSAHCGTIAGNTASASATGSGELLLPDYLGTVFFKDWWAEAIAKWTQSGGATQRMSSGGNWRSTAAVTYVTLIPDNPDFIVGSKFWLYLE